MISVKTIGHKIDFVGNCIAESISYFLVVIPFFIFTPIIAIKILEPISNFSHVAEDPQDFNT